MLKTGFTLLAAMVAPFAVWWALTYSGVLGALAR
jgi:hypothetical protein